MIHVDSHVVAWLFAGDRRRFPVAVARRLEREPIVISPAVELELQLLFEIGRTKQPGKAVISDLAGRVGLEISATPFVAIVAAAAAQTWTRDPFDRMIVGHAQVDRATLLTADESILENFRRARWS